MSVPSSDLGPPTLSPATECVSPGTKVGGTHSPGGDGGGGVPIRTTEEKALYFVYSVLQAHTVKTK